MATRLVTESGGLATKPSCDKPIEDYSILHRGPRQGFVTEGPLQRYVTEGGVGDRNKPLFRVTVILIYVGPYVLQSCVFSRHSSGGKWAGPNRRGLARPRAQRGFCLRIFLWAPSAQCRVELVCAWGPE